MNNILRHLTLQFTNYYATTMKRCLGELGFMTYKYWKDSAILHTRSVVLVSALLFLNVAFPLYSETLYELKEGYSLQRGDVMILRDMAELAEGNPGNMRTQAYVAEDGHKGTLVELLDHHAAGLVLLWPHPGRFVVAAGVMNDTKRAAVQFGVHEPLIWKHAENRKPSDENTVHEIFLDSFETDAEQRPLRIRIQLPLGGRIAYLKITPCPPVDWPKSNISGNKRVLIDNDGYSVFYINMFSTPEIMKGFIQKYRNTDISGLVWCVNNPLEVNYKSNHAPLLFEGTTNFPRPGDKIIHDTIRRFVDAGTDSLDVAIESCREARIRCYAGLRMNTAPNPVYDESRPIPLYDKFKNMRLYEKPGQQGAYLSYAFPEWRRHVLSIIREMAERRPDAVLLEFTRVPPFVGWHPVLIGQFRDQYKIPAKQSIDPNDPRWLAIKSQPLTALLRDARIIIDEVNQAHPDSHKIDLAVHVFHLSGSQSYELQWSGIDINTWIDEKLIDELVVSSKEAYMNLAPWKLPDFAYNAKKIGIPVYCQIDSHHSGHDPTPEEERARARGEKVITEAKNVTPFYYLRTAHDLFKQGADGVFIWDGFFNLGSAYQLGNRDELDIRYRYEVNACQYQEKISFQ